MGAIMFQGTGSDVGKSVIVAGICRTIANRGLRVRPFKAQNMSNNAAVTHDGGEIGRAQATQALACRIEPCIDMNPVLLKPQTDQTAQLVVHGKIRGILGAHNFREGRGALLDDVLASYHRLQTQCDIVVVEGAGSPAEINLRDGDIANMGFARAANVPVILLGDINRGGVIASIVGTRAVIDPKDAALIQGFIINKFRGDLKLFADGYRDIERLSKWRGLGVIPWLRDCSFLPSEDAVVLEKRSHDPAQKLLVACPITPRISNFDDLDPLRLEPALELVMVPPGHPIPKEASLIVLAGSKAAINDLEAIRREGWDIDILAHHRHGGMILGLCGGYQMLGKRIMDPHGIEGPPSEIDGLGLLNIKTELTQNKTLNKVSGRSLGAPCEGYEMHVGSTVGPDTLRPLIHLDGGRTDGATSIDGLVSGTYLHGLFTDSEQRAAWLTRLGLPSSFQNYTGTIDEALNNIAMEIERHVNMKAIIDIAMSFGKN